MATPYKTFVIITNWLTVKCWKQWKIMKKNRTKPGTVLSETVLSGDSLYFGLIAQPEIQILNGLQWVGYADKPYGTPLNWHFFLLIQILKYCF